VGAGEPGRRDANSLLVGGVRQHLQPAAVGAAARRRADTRPGQHGVDVLRVGRVDAVVEVHRHVPSRDRVVWTADVDLVPAAGAPLADGAEARTAGEDVAAESLEVCPARIRDGLLPPRFGRRGAPVHLEFVRSFGAEVALVDRGVDGVAVGAGDAGTQADDGIVDAEPRFAAADGRLQRLETLAERAVFTVGRAAGPRRGGRGVVTDPVGQRLA